MVNWNRALDKGLKGMKLRKGEARDRRHILITFRTRSRHLDLLDQEREGKKKQIFETVIKTGRRRNYALGARRTSMPLG